MNAFLKDGMRKELSRVLVNNNNISNNNIDKNNKVNDDNNIATTCNDKVNNSSRRMSHNSSAFSAIQFACHATAVILLSLFNPKKLFWACFF